MNRPKLEGLFNGSTAADPPAAQPQATPRTVTQEPEAAGLFDPVAIAERYFAVLQSLLDLQHDFGLRLAHQLAAVLPTARLRR